MKTLTGLITFALAAGAGAASTAATTSTKDLKLNCQGHYKVLSADPYYNSHYSPFPKRYEREPEAAAIEVIQIVDLAGADCAKLKPGYGLELFTGQKLNYKAMAPGEASPENAKAFATAEVGKIHSFAVQQQFTYQDKNGNLPLFPLAHAEFAYVLNQSGYADSQFLYGIPALEKLTDQQKMTLLEILYGLEDYGKIYAGYAGSIGYPDVFLKLILEITPTGTDAKLEYATDLKNLFINATSESSYYTGAPGLEIGQKLNKMLNQLGGTKWQTKLQVVEQVPMLLDYQLVSWSKAGEALDLNSTEIETYLAYALEQANLLVNLPQLKEARVLLNQYKNSAKSLLENSKSPTLSGYKYDLSDQATKLIADILAVKVH